MIMTMLVRARAAAAHAVQRLLVMARSRGRQQIEQRQLRGARLNRTFRQR
jgi:hypothetical protein